MIKYLLFIATLLVIFIVGPLASIWALNTLFPALAIPYNFNTWVAALALPAVFKTSIKLKD